MTGRDVLSASGGIIVVASAVVTVLLFHLLVGGGSSEYYTCNSAPDGWYRQRQCITKGMVRNCSIFFAVCDHSYLGPLHGDWTLGEGVSFPVDGWYDLRVEGGVIVEAVLREQWNHD